MDLPNFHHHPQGDVYVRTKDGIYNDSFQNFNTDLMKVSGRSYLGMPTGCIERYYEPRKRSYLIREGYDQIGDGGFSDGEYYISIAQQLILAKKARESLVSE